MSDSAAQELQSFVRRIEALDDEIRALNSDKSEVFKEVKGAGFTAKTLRKVIAARRMDAADRDEADAEFELYWNAVHGIEPDLVRARVENIEQFDADGVLIEPQVAPQPASDLTDSETAGQVAPIQPETANEAGDDLVSSPVEAADHGTFVGTGNPAATGNLGGSNVTATSAQIVTGEGAHNASVTTFIPKPLRPNCQHPERCGGQGRQHCYSCRVAAEQAGAA